MSKGTLIERLLALPAALVAAELALLESETARKSFESHLQTVEDQLLLSGSLDGKNAELRAAQMRAQTAHSREGVAAAAATMAACRIRRDHLQAEFSSLKSIAHVMGGE